MVGFNKQNNTSIDDGKLKANDTSVPLSGFSYCPNVFIISVPYQIKCLSLVSSMGSGRMDSFCGRKRSSQWEPNLVDWLDGRRQLSRVLWNTLDCRYRFYWICLLQNNEKKAYNTPTTKTLESKCFPPYRRKHRFLDMHEYRSRDGVTSGSDVSNTGITFAWHRWHEPNEPSSSLPLWFQRQAIR